MASGRKIQMRLGGPAGAEPLDPDTWIQDLQRQGYRAATLPALGDDPHNVDWDVWLRAAAKADIVIAEVGYSLRPQQCQEVYQELLKGQGQTLRTDTDDGI